MAKPATAETKPDINFVEDAPPVTRESFLIDDERARKLLKDVADGVYSLDIEARLKEVQGIHLARKIHTLKTGTLLKEGYGRAKLIDVVNQNARNRARLIAVKMEAMDKRMRLEEKTRIVRLFLQTKYMSKLADKFKTVEERRKALDNSLVEADHIVASLQGLESQTEEAVKDIDQAFWHLKLVADLLHSASAREHTL